MSRDFNDILREEGIEVARQLDATAVKYEPPKDNFGEKSQLRARGEPDDELQEETAPAGSEEALALSMGPCRTARAVSRSHGHVPRAASLVSAGQREAVLPSRRQRARASAPTLLDASSGSN